MTDHQKKRTTSSGKEPGSSKREGAGEGNKFWHIADWKDALKLCGLPLAFALGVYTFYDDVWLRFKHQDTATVDRVIEGLAKLQSLDHAVYSHQAEGDMSGAIAVDAAQQGLRQRLVAQAYDHWKRTPDFFQRGELDTLAHHLILQGRARDALHIIDALLEHPQNALDRADKLLKKGRAYGANGDAFDLEKARSALRASFHAAESIPNRGTRLAAITNITYYRTFLELYHEQPCESVAPFIEILQEVRLEGPDEEMIDKNIEDLISVYEGRC